MSVHKPNRKQPAPRRRSVAFYDLDGTLTDLNLLHCFAYFVANVGEWTGRVSHVLRLAATLPALYLAESSDRRLLNSTIYGVLKGLSRDRLQMVGEEYCERI